MGKERRFYKNKFKNVFGELIGTPVGRATFVNLSEPNTKYKPAKYGLQILFPKDDPAAKTQLNAMITMCKAMAAEEFGTEVPNFKYGVVRDGDDSTNEKGEHYQGFENCWFIKAANQNKVRCVDSKNNDIDPSLIVPGVKVRAVVKPILFEDGFAWNTTLVQLIADDGVRYYKGADPMTVLSAIDEVTSEEPAKEEAEEVQETAKAPSSKPAKAGKAKALDLL